MEAPDVTRVFVSGPYTQGNTQLNVHNACVKAAELLGAGYHPYVPHLWHYVDIRFPGQFDYEFWINHCLRELRTQDVILRLPGKSPGADEEVAAMAQAGRLVVHSIEELKELVPVRRSVHLDVAPAPVHRDAHAEAPRRGVTGDDPEDVDS